MAAQLSLGEYDPEWPALYELERRRLLTALGEAVQAVTHIGSTTVPGLAAKPRIDLLVGLSPGADLAPIVEALVALGYQHRHSIPEWSLCARPGYNVHLTPYGSSVWTQHLRFRDYLRDHAETEQAPRQLEQMLAAHFGDDLVAYAVAKVAFVAAFEGRVQSMLSSTVAGMNPRWTIVARQLARPRLAKP